jgi:hypothetical protein
MALIPWPLHRNFQSTGNLRSTRLLAIFVSLLANVSFVWADNAKTASPDRSISVFRLPDHRQIVRCVGPRCTQCPTPQVEPKCRTFVQLRCVPFGMSIVRKLAPIVPIGALDVCGAGLSNDDLTFLNKSCDGLRSLTLSDSSLLGDDELSDLTASERGALKSQQLSEQVLCGLANLKELHTLKLTGCSLPPTGLKFLAAFRQLNQLQLEKLHLNDNDLRFLAPLPNLQMISLVDMPVTAAGLRSLRDCRSLRVIHFSRTGLTDESMLQLDSALLNRIEQIRVEGCEVTEETLDSLRKAHPNTKFERFPDALPSSATIATVRPPGNSDAQAIRLLRARCRLLHSLSVAAFVGTEKLITEVKVDAERQRELGDWVFADIAGFKGLQRLELTRCNISATALDYLQEAVTLESIRLDRSSIDDAGLRQLGKLPHLKRIALPETKITDVGLMELAKHHELTALVLDHTGLTGKGIKALRSLKNLKYISLKHCQVGDVEMEQLAGMASLESVAVDGTQIGDRGIGILAKLPHLKWLSLADCAISDEGAAELLKAPNLAFCKFDLARVSEAMKNKLRQHLLAVRTKDRLAGTAPRQFSATEMSDAR